MTSINEIAKHFILVFFIVFLSIGIYAQKSPYQAIRLNNGNPIITPSMFNNPDDGKNINGPSLIRVPDWIPVNKRANPSAQYYLYFAHHAGDYIRMAWAANIEGPYTLYNDFTTLRNRGVLDNNECDIILKNNIVIQENHLASPDVIIDDINKKIIMYFHTGASFFVNGIKQKKQVTWVTTAPYGLEFYKGIESVHLGDSYFRVFKYDDNLYALDNGAKIYKALDNVNPWDTPPKHDFTKPLWEVNSNHVFQNDIPVPSGQLRVRHTGTRVVGDTLHVFYSRRGELQEKIQLSTVDMSTNWTSWNPTYPPIDILVPNPGWEGGHHKMVNSRKGASINKNQLRDPDVFEDVDGQLYLTYTGNGEGGIGIAKLYETPTENIILPTIADTHVKKHSNTNFGLSNTLRVSKNIDSSSHNTIYLKFDLSNITNLSHAVVRLYANKTNGGPVTVYKTSNHWDETTLTSTNSPFLDDAITTSYLTNSGTYYEWNITEYAKTNIGTILSLAFSIAPLHNANHEFDSMQGKNPGQLLLVANTEEK